MASDNQVTSQRTFLGHPLGLYVLFFTEMWERFSYYGMRALLILYLVNYFKMAQDDAAYVYKWYTSMVYLTPLIGGFLADRYLGNRLAVIIGAILMAIGHFLMAFEDLGIIYAALGFLIIGNGFFKPNMSTQVGRLYPTNDNRRDGAYTIFYMGINLGAFLSPLACGWLAANTIGEYHSGFTLAGIGMVFGLVIYLFGQPFIKEVDPSVVATPDHRSAIPEEAEEKKALTEQEALQTPSNSPLLSRIMPNFLIGLGVVCLIAAPFTYYYNIFSLFDAIALVLTSGSAFFAAWIASQLRESAVRDRVIALYLLFLLPVFFWAAFEQTGNALNLWADKTTDRYLSQEDQPPPRFPELIESKETTESAAAETSGGLIDRFRNMFYLKPDRETSTTDTLNPVPTAWFQSINALAIFMLAPVFAFLWTKVSVPIPVKLIFGLVFMAAAMLVMVIGATQEHQPTEVKYTADLPQQVYLTADNQLATKEGDNGELEAYHTGRLRYDPDEQVFQMDGVLPDIERDRIVRSTAPEWFQEQIVGKRDADGEVVTPGLQQLSKKATKAQPVSLKLDRLPEGFDWRYAGIPKAVATFDPNTDTITVTKELGDKEVKGIFLAAGNPEFRDAMTTLMIESAQHRVTPWWLVFHFVLATIGELCLSPVGLSATSKLAPKKYATMLMGLWLLTSFFGGFLAGTMGELYSKIPPIQFFTISVIALGILSLLAFAGVKKVIRMMHGVN